LLEYGVPSLTLQLLLENAVKHNVISPARPLLIEIFSFAPATVSDAAWVTVRNNVQRKIQPVVSHQLGLNNIILKFTLLNQPQVSISDADGYFTVRFPLFKMTE
jgi:two-component system, LytTR family, sensor kinase